MRIIKFLSSVFTILAITSCFPSDAGNKVFRYFELANTNGSIIYSDKHALNNLIIVRKYGSINIVSVPFTMDEYKERLKMDEYKESLKLSKANKSAEFLQPIELEISGRKIKVLKKNVNKNDCFATANDYYNGVAIFITYFGTCNLSTDLKPVLKSITYREVKDNLVTARNNFLNIMKMIEKMNIPTYKKAYEAQSDYSFLGCTKRITYNVNEVKNSFNILYLYRDYFLSNGWKQYDSENVGDWFDNKLFYSWIDNTGEMLAKLVIVSDSKIKNTKLVKQTVYLNVTPYLITRWPTTEKVDTACRP